MGTFLWSFVVLFSDFLWHGKLVYDLLFYCIQISLTWVLFVWSFGFFSIQIFSDLDNLCMIYCCIGLRFSLTCVLCVWFIVVLHSDFLRLWYFMYDLLLYCIEIFSGLGTLFMIYFCFSFIFSSGLGTLYMIYCCFVFRNVSGLGTLCMIYCCIVFRFSSGLGTLFMIYFCFSFRFSSGLGTLLMEINMLCYITTSSDLGILCMKRCCIVFRLLLFNVLLSVWTVVHIVSTFLLRQVLCVYIRDIF